MQWMCMFFLFRSTLPIWEECIIFNENFDYLCQPTMNVILFFEVSYTHRFANMLFASSHIDYTCNY